MSSPGPAAPREARRPRLVIAAACILLAASLLPFIGLVVSARAGPCDVQASRTDCWGAGMGTLAIVALAPFVIYAVVTSLMVLRITARREPLAIGTSTPRLLRIGIALLLAPLVAFAFRALASAGVFLSIAGWCTLTVVLSGLAFSRRASAA